MLLTANPRSTPFIQAFERKLAELGYVEGRNLIIEYRDAEGQIKKLPGLASELVRAGVDVIVTTTELGTRAVKETSDRIAVLMVAINFDPLALGFIESIARPGRNMTGLFFQQLDLLSKRFGLLKEMLPSAERGRRYLTKQIS